MAVALPFSSTPLLASLKAETKRRISSLKSSCSVPGCEDIIREHFRLQRVVVLKQCSDWLRDSEAGDEERKLRRVIDELRVELGKLEDDGQNVSQESMETS